MKNFLIGLAVFLLIAALMFGIVLLGYTYVEWWIPTTAAAVIAVLTLPVTQIIRQKGNRKNGILTYLIHLCTAGIIAFTGIMAANRYMPGTDEHHEDGIIARKYSEERTRRVGRRHMVRRTREYYVVVQLPDSTTFEQPVSIEYYNRVRTGARYDVTVRTGFLGWRVVE